MALVHHLPLMLQVADKVPFRHYARFLPLLQFEFQSCTGVPVRVFKAFNKSVTDDFKRPLISGEVKIPEQGTQAGPGVIKAGIFEQFVLLAEPGKRHRASNQHVLKFKR